MLFTKFSHASGLEANLDKSNLYTAGVSGDKKDVLKQIVSVPSGSFPLKYLVVPLSTRKLFYHECKALIDKTLARVRLWLVKKLSYAIRLQLVTSILHGFQLYLCQIFILPKKVFKEIQSICRIYL